MPKDVTWKPRDEVNSSFYCPGGEGSVSKKEQGAWSKAVTCVKTSH